MASLRSWARGLVAQLGEHDHVGVALGDALDDRRHRRRVGARALAREAVVVDDDEGGGGVASGERAPGELALHRERAAGEEERQQRRAHPQATALVVRSTGSVTVRCAILAHSRTVGYHEAVSANAIYLKQLELGPMQNFVYLVGDPEA
ncbi:MAG: hypothetical protein HYV94_19325, partial [Candidatus Rokubacteria bacterium]|nr:hypothetical protein [Candidatus Rokubacteria bacterium]